MPKKSKWGKAANDALIRVWRAHCDSDPETFKKALFDAYPFGERKYHPYKIWNAQKKHYVTIYERRQKVKLRYKKSPLVTVENPKQLKLF